MKNARMDEYHHESYRVWPGMSWLFHKESDERGQWWQGTVKHEKGTVSFYQGITYPSKNHKGSKSLSLHFIHKGKEHRRYWNAFYGKKTITRLANQFIEDVVEGRV